jgi:hypothetical protein
MSPGARLISVDAVADLSAALHKFGEEAGVALSDLDMDLKRAVEWIRHDRKEYWGQEVRQGYDRVAEARANLERRMIFRVGQERPSAVEEKKALELSKRRLETAQQKTQAVRRWSYAVEREMNEYVAVIGQLTAWLQNDLPRALASLKRMRTALDAYVGTPNSPEAISALKKALARAAEPDEQLLEMKGPAAAESPAAEEGQADGAAAEET